MSTAPYSNLVKGSLLLATAEVSSGIFFRGVVLICEHGPQGTLGVLVNKPLEMALPEEITDLKETANPHVEMRSGGPMQPTQMMMLHSSDKSPEQTLKVCEGVYLGGDLPFLQEAIGDSNGPHIRLCFGYGGWGPGELEQEFLKGLWFLHPATSKHVFEMPTHNMWQMILREMGGRYATLSMIPEDLNLN